MLFVNHIFFWIAANAAFLNPKGTKTLLANDISTFLINGKATFVNGAKKLSSPPFSILIFLVVPFSKAPIF